MKSPSKTLRCCSVRGNRCEEGRWRRATEGKLVEGSGLNLVDEGAKLVKWRGWGNRGSLSCSASLSFQLVA